MGDFPHKSIASNYFKRFGFRNQLIEIFPSKDLGIIIVIPSFKEKELQKSLDSINACEIPTCDVEIIVVINNSEDAEVDIKSFHLEMQKELISYSSRFSLHIIAELSLPKKHAGVGLARKIGMDEAARRFAILDKNGVIACFDADATCDPNYLVEIESKVIHSNAQGASIYYEHPLEGKEFDSTIYKGIINYELFLRYYNLASKFAGIPYTFHTVGSSMLVKSEAYMLKGGMNKRKAGEDFYFLHKIIQTNKVIELNTTKVIPSPRTSDRVPFGTGKAISDWLAQENEIYKTYDFQVFIELQKFVGLIDFWYDSDFNYNQLPKDLIAYFEKQNMLEKVEEIKKNTTTKEHFVNRFYVWFDAFNLLKLVHWHRDYVKPNQPILEMVNVLNSEFLHQKVFETEKDALLGLRKRERNTDSNSFKLQ